MIIKSHLIIVYFIVVIGYFRVMSEKVYWYQKRKLKHITGFLTAEEKARLKMIAERESDLTLTRYVSILLKRHIETHYKKPSNHSCNNCKNFVSKPT